jgi:hypothetical protein
MIEIIRKPEKPERFFYCMCGCDFKCDDYSFADMKNTMIKRECPDCKTMLHKQFDVDDGKEYDQYINLREKI